MKKKNLIGTFLVTAVSLALLTACGGGESSSGGQSAATQSKVQEDTKTSSSSAKSEKESSGKNTVDWNGNFNGVELPAPGGRSKVSEYIVKENAVTIWVDGMTWQEYVDYCKELEALPGWEADEDENTANFPDDPDMKSKVYCSGVYKELPHISAQYLNDEDTKKNGSPNFVMFVFTKW